eukprot:scaffold923_cov256-Pinguiococcus_pyrenoidosus.AAC.3
MPAKSSVFRPSPGHGPAGSRLPHGGCGRRVSPVCTPSSAVAKRHVLPAPHIDAVVTPCALSSCPSAALPTVLEDDAVEAAATSLFGKSRVQQARARLSAKSAELRGNAVLLTAPSQINCGGPIMPHEVRENCPPAPGASVKVQAAGAFKRRFQRGLAGGARAPRFTPSRTLGLTV